MSEQQTAQYVVRRGSYGGWRWWLRTHEQVVAAAARTAHTPADAGLQVLHIRITAALGPTDVVTDRYGGWRWRLFTGAGHVVAVSAIGCASHWAAERALERFRCQASHAELSGEEPQPLESGPV